MAPQGWYRVSDRHKAHYCRDGMALCTTASFSSVQPCEPHHARRPGDCARCWWYLDRGLAGSLEQSVWLVAREPGVCPPPPGPLPANWNEIVRRYWRNLHANQRFG